MPWWALLGLEGLGCATRSTSWMDTEWHGRSMRMAYRLRRVEPAATSQARKSARLQSPFERARLGQSVAQLELDGERLAGGIVDRERDRDVEPPLRRPQFHVRYERRR